MHVLTVDVNYAARCSLEDGIWTGTFALDIIIVPHPNRKCPPGVTETMGKCNSNVPIPITVGHQQ